jgi:hypothetical protein
MSTIIFFYPFESITLVSVNLRSFEKLKNFEFQNKKTQTKFDVQTQTTLSAGLPRE